jgi:hypothetical protein
MKWRDVNLPDCSLIIYALENMLIIRPCTDSPTGNCDECPHSEWRFAIHESMSFEYNSSYNITTINEFIECIDLVLKLEIFCSNFL